MERKKWYGIRQNKCTFQGEVTGISDDGNYIFLDLESKSNQRDQNGQYVELEQVVPLMVEPGSISNVVRKYVQQGRKLLVECSYRSWTNEGVPCHAFAVDKLELGDKPYTPKDDSKPF